jgi:cation diffusion facilitator family transporter
MSTVQSAPLSVHPHVFLGAGHERNERRTWFVIVLCGFMMVAEIIGGLLFGSIALVADGLHMSTHASALLLAALAYRYARRHAEDRRFTFGTGKLGDLAGFTSAIVLAMIALLIGYEAVTRFFAPVPISFDEAIPIAGLGLLVNVASVLLLSGGGHHHHHGHGHAHGHDDDAHEHEHDQARRIETEEGAILLEIFEKGVPPRFRLSFEGARPAARDVTIETIRAGGVRQVFGFVEREGHLESAEEIPEPHAFDAQLRLGSGTSHAVAFREDEQAHAADRDNNMRAAIVHVLADATVSVLVITGLLIARFFGWLWIDPVVGIVGAFVIAAWAYSLIRDTSAILLDMNPDWTMAEHMRAVIEADGDRLTDLHLWRLGPGHLGAIVSVATAKRRDPEHYRRLLDRFRNLSHVTVEVRPAA